MSCIRLSQWFRSTSLSASLAACLAWQSLLPTAPAVEIEADRVVFFVNADIITKHDLERRLEMILQAAQARGQVLPRGRELAMLRYQLAQTLIEETLLVQEFDKMQFPVEEAEIRRDVFRRDPGASGKRMMDLEEQVQQRIRQFKTDFIIRFYAHRRPNPAPAELFEIYQENINDYAQPGRLRPLKIIMPPPAKPPTDEQMMFMLRDCLRFPTLQPALTDELRQAYRDADPGSPELREVFEELAANILRIAETVELTDPAKVFIEQVTEVHQRMHAVAVDPAEKLAEIRASVSELPANEQQTAFQTAAKEWSQGPMADQGGDLGWIEIGDNPTLDEIWRDLEAGHMSPVELVGKGWVLIYMQEKKPATVKPFNAVAAELEALHRQKAMAETRRNILRVLQERAIIKPVDPPPKPEAETEDAEGA